MKYVSGIRPTGSIHLGNYLGAIKPWLELQEKHDCVFFVADLHTDALCSEVDSTTEQLLALGLHGVKIQSDFALDILQTYHRLAQQVPVSWLNRMTQYKDKVAAGEDATLSLLAYPVLMAADIFYFGGTHIPVGADQKQHVEFARDLQTRFPEYAKPEPVIMGYPRVMSLTEGTKKMSKSAPDDNGRINVTDSADVIRRKVRKAKSGINLSSQTPEMINLFGIYNALGGDPLAMFKGCGEFKDALADLIINELRAK